MSCFADGFDDLGVVEETASEVPGVADFSSGEEFFRIRMYVHTCNRNHEPDVQ